MMNRRDSDEVQPPSPNPQDAQGPGIISDPSTSSERYPLPYILTRVCINSSFYWTLLPYVLLICIRQANLGGALIVGCSFSCFCLLFNLGMWATKRKKEYPYIMDGILALFFVVYLAVYFGAHKHQTVNTNMERWVLVVVHGWLCLAILGSVAARQPFTLQYAREVAPEEAWNSPSLIATCDQLACMWAIGFGFTCLLCLAPALKNQGQGKHGLNVVFNYIWPLLTLVGLIGSTRWFPEFIRRTLYIPRMMKATVTPNASSGDPESGSTSHNTTGTSSDRQDGVVGGVGRQLSSPSMVGPSRQPTEPGFQEQPRRGQQVV